MEKVKIKRVKRNKKKATTKEKILAGLGVGGALMGGLSSVAPQRQKQEILSQNTPSNSPAGSKIKSALKNIFGATFGVAQAKADNGTTERDGQVFGINQYTGQEYLIGDVGSPAAEAVTAPTVTESPVVAPAYNPGVGTDSTQAVLDPATGKVMGTNPVTGQTYVIGDPGSPAAIAAGYIAPVAPPATPPPPAPEVAPPPTDIVTPKKLDKTTSVPGTVTVASVSSESINNATKATITVVDDLGNPTQITVDVLPDGRIFGTDGQEVSGLSDSVKQNIISSVTQAGQNAGLSTGPASVVIAPLAPPAGLSPIGSPGGGTPVTLAGASSLTSNNASTTTYDPALDNQISNIHDSLASQITAGQVESINGDSVTAHELGWGQGTLPDGTSVFYNSGDTKQVGALTYAFDGATWYLQHNQSPPATPVVAPPTTLTPGNASTTTYDHSLDNQLTGVHDTLANQITSGQVEAINGDSVSANLLGWGGYNAVGATKTVGDQTYTFDGSTWYLQHTQAPVATPHTGDLRATGITSQIYTSNGIWVDTSSQEGINTIIAKARTTALSPAEQTVFDNYYRGGLHASTIPSSFGSGSQFAYDLGLGNGSDGVTTRPGYDGKTYKLVNGNWVAQAATPPVTPPGTPPSAPKEGDVNASGQVYHIVDGVGGFTNQVTLGNNPSQAALGTNIIPDATGSGFTITFTDGIHADIYISGMDDLHTKINSYNTANASDQQMAGTLGAIYNRINSQKANDAVTALGTAAPVTSTGLGGTLTFSNNLGGSGLGVGNNWVINVTGAAPTAPVYAFGSVNGGAPGWIYLGTTDAQGNLNKQGPTLGTADVGTWNVKIQVGKSNAAVSTNPTGTTQVGSTLQFAVRATAATTPGDFTPTFNQTVQGDGPYGKYNINPNYYADQTTANWLANRFGGTVITVNPNSSMTRFTYPDQLFIQFPDGTKINAGQLATYAFTNPAGLSGQVPANVLTAMKSDMAGLAAFKTANPAVIAGLTAGPSVRFSTNGIDSKNPKVGDAWQIIVTGLPGQAVYATTANGTATQMGTIGSDGRLMLNGTFSLSDLSGGNAKVWDENWFVGSNPTTNPGNAVAAGAVNFTLNSLGVTASTIPAQTGLTLEAKVDKNSDGSFTVTLTDGSTIRASSTAEFGQKMQKYNTNSPSDQKIFNSFSAAIYAIEKQLTPPAPIVGSPNPVSSTGPGGTLTFSNNLGGSGLGVGNNWVINVTGAAHNAAVYAFNAVDKSYVYLGTTDGSGNLKVAGPTLGSADVNGSWKIQVQVGDTDSGNAFSKSTPILTPVAKPTGTKIAGTELDFGVGTAKITTQGAFTPTFIPGVLGNGIDGKYNLNSAYYADDATAAWLASQIPGSKVIKVTPNLGGGFTYPEQNFIQMSDGTYINAGELATQYLSGNQITSGSTTADLGLNFQRLQQTVSGEQGYHKASTGDVTPDGVRVVSWTYDPIQGYVGTDAQGRYVKIQDGKWAVSESTAATAVWLSLGPTGPAQVTGFTLTKQGESLYGSEAISPAVTTIPSTAAANSTVSINTTTLPNATVGVLYGQQISASNLSSTAVWSATGLPAGLLINSTTGVISGTPTTAGTKNIVVSVVSGGQTITKTITLNVIAAASSNTAAVVTSLTPASALTGTILNITILGTNLTGAVLSFPAGSGVTISQVVINSSGTQITANFAVAATASVGDKTLTITTPVNSVTKAFSVTTPNTASAVVSSLNLSKISSAVTVGGATDSVTATVNLSDGTTSNNVTVTSSSSNAVVTVNANGVITITGVTAGTAIITVHPAAATDTSNDKIISVTVSSATVVAPTYSLSVSQTGLNLLSGQSATVVATVTSSGGVVSRQVTAGSSNSGVATVSADPNTGIISISANGIGTAAITVHPVAMGTDASQDKIITIYVANPAGGGGGSVTGTVPYFTNISILPNAIVGQSYNSAVLAVANYSMTFRVLSGSLPPGLGLNSNGLFSGVPSVAGNYSFIVQATTSQGLSSSQQFTISVFPAGSAAYYSGGGGAVYAQVAGASIFQGLQMPGGAFQGLQMPTDYQAPGQTSPAESGTYTVKKGDTLWSIAKKQYGDGRKWRKILEANTDKVKSPKTLKIGTVLVIPTI